MQQSDADKWNNIYRAGDHGNGDACQVLAEHIHLLPTTGCALDLACGMGGNAILLANQGLVTSAWDISEAAIRKLDAQAKKQNLRIITQVTDVTRNPPVHNSFDIIVISRFLERQLIPDLKQAIRPDGLIFYQTYTRIRADEKGPQNPDYLLKDNELLSLFHDFRILFYREEGITGNLERGYRNEAMLVAQKQA
jgi:2-polyprenyl-3-methyl-5-hydroxy-6-metoxy-1,4-benzoquinol methylase